MNRPHHNKKWTTKDGTKIRIRSMTIIHIENSLNMLERIQLLQLVVY